VKQTLETGALVGGVSTQPPHRRFANQIEEAVNVDLDFETGAVKRNGTILERRITGLDGAGLYRTDILRIGPDEAYNVVWGDDSGTFVVRLFRIGGVEATVNIDANAQVYLDYNDPDATEVRVRVIDDRIVLVNTTVPIFTNSADTYAVTRTFDDYLEMTGHTPADSTFHEAQNDDVAQDEGFWQYDVDAKTFATQEYADVTGGTWANPSGNWDNSGSYGFTIGFQRIATLFTGGTWDNTAKTLTKTGAFASYTFMAGDKIYLTAGTGITTPAWFDIVAKDDDDTLELDNAIDAGGNQVDFAASGIGIEFEVVYTTDGTTLASMHKVAQKLEESFEAAGVGDVAVEWLENAPQSGHFVITSRYRGSGATITAATAPTTGGVASLIAAGAPFETASTTTAGTGTVTAAEITLAIEDRWVRTSPSGQADAQIEAGVMPVEMIRDFADEFTVRRMTFEARPGADTPTNNPSPSMFREIDLRGDITVISTANPAQVTSAGHGLVTGDEAFILESDSGVSIDGTHTVTRIDDDNFTVPVDNTGAAGTDGRWVKGGVELRDVAGYRQRQGYVGGKFATFTRIGTVGNFYRESGATLADSDPIDAPISDDQIVDLDFAEPFQRSLVLLSRSGRQFETNPPEAFTPTTASFTRSTKYDTQSVRPTQIDVRMYFVQARPGDSAIREYLYDEIAVATSAADVTGHYRDRIPTAVRTIRAHSDTRRCYVLPDDDANVLHVYHSYWSGDEKIQSAWSSYEFDDTVEIIDIAIDRSDLWLLTRINTRYTLERMPLGEEDVFADPSGDAYPYVIHLDRRIQVSGTYDGGQDETTFDIDPFQASGSTLNWLVEGPDFAGAGDEHVGGTGNGWVYEAPPGTEIVVPGDLSDGEVVLGRFFDATLVLSRPFVRDARGNASPTRRVDILMVAIGHGEDTTDYVLSAVDANAGTIDRSQSFQQNDVGRMEAGFGGSAKDMTYTIAHDGARPMTITDASFEVYTEDEPRGSR
jgi:hypothetical protein